MEMGLKILMLYTIANGLFLFLDLVFNIAGAMGLQ